MDKKFLCGFHNRTKMKGCDTQCSSCKADQTIIDLRNRIKELEDDKNRMLRQLEVVERSAR
jgi:hypothetical protein